MCGLQYVGSTAFNSRKISFYVKQLHNYKSSQVDCQSPLALADGNPKQNIFMNVFLRDNHGGLLAKQKSLIKLIPQIPLFRSIFQYDSVKYWHRLGLTSRKMFEKFMRYLICLIQQGHYVVIIKRECTKNAKIILLLLDLSQACKVVKYELRKTSAETFSKCVLHHNNHRYIGLHENINVWHFVYFQLIIAIILCIISDIIITAKIILAIAFIIT